MTEEKLREAMDKSLKEIFDTESIIDFHFSLIQKGFLSGLQLGMKVERDNAKDLVKKLSDFIISSTIANYDRERDVLIGQANAFLKEQE